MKISKKFKKITFYSLVGVLLMSTVLLCGIIVANANATSGNWSDSGNYTRSALSKDEDGCYMIQSEEDLARMNYNSSAYFKSTAKLKLYADLDMSAHYWTPASRDFKGTFYGQNHTIKNLFTEYSSSSNPSDYSGLFKKLNGARIYDLKLDTISTTGLYYSGALAGEASSSTISNVEIKDCSIDARNTTLSELSENMYAGGIVGYISGTTIERCKSFNTDVCVSNKINSTSNSTTLIMYAGGIVGFSAPSSDISACRVIDGNVRFYPLGQGSGSIFVADTLYIGGIVGKAIDTDIEICSNEHTYIQGGVEGNSRLYCSINYAYLGGIAGYLDGSPVTACFNTGEVDGFTNIYGEDIVSTGVKGSSVNTVFYVLYREDVNAGVGSTQICYRPLYMGGIAGYSNSNIDNCYNVGTIKKDNSKVEKVLITPVTATSSGVGSSGVDTYYFTATVTVKISGVDATANDICGKLDSGSITKCFTDFPIWSGENLDVQSAIVRNATYNLAGFASWWQDTTSTIASSDKWEMISGQLDESKIFCDTRNYSVSIKAGKKSATSGTTIYNWGDFSGLSITSDCENGIEVSDDGLSSEYYAEDNNINSGYPHLKEFYWADNTNSD